MYTSPYLSKQAISIISLPSIIKDPLHKLELGQINLCEHIELIDSKIIDGRGRYHLLLIHKDDQYPDGLNKIHQSEDINNIDIKYN